MILRKKITSLLMMCFYTICSGQSYYDKIAISGSDNVIETIKRELNNIPYLTVGFVSGDIQPMASGYNYDKVNTISSFYLKNAINIEYLDVEMYDGKKVRFNKKPRVGGGYLTTDDDHEILPIHSIGAAIYLNGKFTVLNQNKNFENASASWNVQEHGNFVLGSLSFNGSVPLKSFHVIVHCEQISELSKGEWIADVERVRKAYETNKKNKDSNASNKSAKSTHSGNGLSQESRDYFLNKDKERIEKWRYENSESYRREKDEEQWKKQKREAERKQREYENAIAKEKAEKQALIDRRYDLTKEYNFSAFPDARNDIGQNIIHFFFYSFSRHYINQENVGFMVSNIFSVERKPDGTWSASEDLLKEIRAFMDNEMGNLKEQEQLHYTFPFYRDSRIDYLAGYYESSFYAEMDRDKFIQDLSRTGAKVRTLHFEGIQYNTSSFEALANAESFFKSGDYKNAIHYYERAAKLGKLNAESYYKMGQIYMMHYGGNKPNHKLAAEAFTKASDMGFAAATFELGLMHTHGYHFEYDTHKALDYFVLAYERGFRKAKNYTLDKLHFQDKNGKWGYKSRNGEILIRAQFDDVTVTLWSNQEPVYKAKKNGKWALINPLGELMTPFEYDGFGAFYKLSFMAKKDGKVGIIRNDGTILIPFQYDEIKDTYTKEGKKFHIVVNEGKWGIINEKNQIVLPFRYDHIDLLGGRDIVMVHKNKLIGFLNLNTARIIVEPKYKSASRFYADGFAIVQDAQTRKWGVIDQLGNMVIPATFEVIGNESPYNNNALFNDGLVPARKGDKWGYINKTGQWVIEPSFYYAKSFNNKTGTVQKKKKSKRYKIDLTGKKVKKQH